MFYQSDPLLLTDPLLQNQQKYEKAAKEADAASQAFARVNEDMNATKAQVEKVSETNV